MRGTGSRPAGASIAGVRLSSRGLCFSSQAERARTGAAQLLPPHESVSPYCGLLACCRSRSFLSGSPKPVHRQSAPRQSALRLSQRPGSSCRRLVTPMRRARIGSVRTSPACQWTSCMQIMCCSPSSRSCSPGFPTALWTMKAGFYNSNGIAAAPETAVEPGSNYYTLSYSPANKTFDGKFRKSMPCWQRRDRPCIIARDSSPMTPIRRPTTRSWPAGPELWPCSTDRHRHANFCFQQESCRWVARTRKRSIAQNLATF